MPNYKSLFVWIFEWQQLLFEGEMFEKDTNRFSINSYVNVNGKVKVNSVLYFSSAVDNSVFVHSFFFAKIDYWRSFVKRWYFYTAEKWYFFILADSNNEWTVDDKFTCVIEVMEHHHTHIKLYWHLHFACSIKWLRLWLWTFTAWINC